MNTVKWYNIIREYTGGGVTFNRMGLYLKEQGLSENIMFGLRPE